MQIERPLTDEEADAAWRAEVATAQGDEPPADATAILDALDLAVPTEETVAVDPVTPPAAKPAAQDADPMMQRIETLTSTLEKMGNDLKATNGRLASMQSEAEQARRAAAHVQDAPTAAQIAAAQGDLTKWDALKGDFPEWSDAMAQYVDAKVNTLAQRIPAAAPAAQPVDIESIRAQLRQEMKAEMEFEKVADKHENWLADVKTPEFKAWFDKQTPEVKALSASARARDTIKVLDSFYEGRAQAAALQQTRQGKLANAAAGTRVNSRPAPPAMRSDSELTADEIWQQEVARMQKERSTT